MSKSEILGRVRDSLQINPLHTESASYTNPLKDSSDSKIQEYIALQNANKAIVIESTANSLAQDICKVIADEKSQKILYNPNIKKALDIAVLRSLNADSEFIAYEKSIDESREELFCIDTSIIHADCGVANLGIFGIASSPDAPRLSSLITRNCIVLLKKEDVVSHFYDGVLKLKGQDSTLPTNMIFIAGPSRTADIELQTVFGVHGSLRTYIILY